jgi:glutamate dehydrogenase
MKSLKKIADRSHLSLEDLITLYEYILDAGYMTREKVVEEIERFAIGLNIDAYYFKTTPIDEMAGHLIATSASRLLAQFGGEDVGIQLISEREERAIYFVEISKVLEIEERLEEKYSGYRLESYRTGEDLGLRLYILTKPVFENAGNVDRPEVFTDFAEKAFLETSAPETINRYEQAWKWMGHRMAPYIAVTEKAGTEETRIMVGIQGRTGTFLSGFTRLIKKYGIHSNRKYRELFQDGKRVFSFYFNRIDEKVIEELSLEINTMITLPNNPIAGLFFDGTLNSQPTMYAISAEIFTNQFLTALTSEYRTLSMALKDQPEAKGILDKMKLRMIKDTFTESKIVDTVIKHHNIVSLIYEHFACKLHPFKKDAHGMKRLEDLILSRIETDVPVSLDKMILEFFLVFNAMILKTNFFKKYKICAAYRLDTAFLDISDFPEPPYGVFYIVGKHFLGYHVRFRDVARGGIRIVRSRNLSEYWKNRDLIFMENYNLASTQQKKNKDIPEGGSKGIILLDADRQDGGPRAFKEYVDGLLDIIVEHEEIVSPDDIKTEILFLGPDERTADLMDWASSHANRQGYPFWKAFTTGKAPASGGIPHDTYGMTTASVHEYVLGILEKLKLCEKSVSKLQTGGPDGDLGSNEIIVSKDKTIGVVDGSGVLFDPAGINREELLRLAGKRAAAENFDKALLSPEGFFVSVEDKKITLPDGTQVPNGEEFRNSFHLHPLAAADLFVPCGGRPAAVNINNWKMLLDDKGAAKFKIIVEGANLFITEQARLRLEEKGVIVIKDASANKGGVTSSSLEVLAALAMSDDEFDQHMRVKDNAIPDFMKSYIQSVLETIKDNARWEFNLLWSEHEKNNIPFTHLTNRLSKKINDITDAVFNSQLPAQRGLREKIITEFVPKPLLELVGAQTILKRVPAPYLNAIVASKVATNYIYSYGMDSNEIDFYHYLKTYI